MSLDAYQDRILDHYKRPRNFGPLEGATASARDTNTVCGDDITMHLKVADGGRIEEARFQGRGCAISTASASLLTEALRGMTVEEALKVDRAFMEAQVRVPLKESQKPCMMLSSHVLHLALGRGEKGKIEA
jgi:nitrogen fixation NifU-like protein